MGYIYKITNDVNNKIYIGMTRRSISQRWSDHVQKAKTINIHLYAAMRKYGIDKFHIEMIEECSNEDLPIREAYWIDFYNSYKQGYNMTEGKGEGNDGSISARPIEQYDLNGNYLNTYKSVGQAASILNIQSANIQRAAHQRCNSAGGFQWRYVDDSERIITKIEEHKSGGKGRIVYQYDLNWHLITTYSSNRQAAATLGMNYPISKKYLQSDIPFRGYYWRYEPLIKEEEI